ncbi:MAG: PQQ-binding-like beta-propeller repeat protein [Planctomycetota bacterium]
MQHCLIALLGLCASSADETAVEAWTAFQNGGRPPAESAAKAPLEWSPEEGVLWTAELDGYGQSTPLVWGPHVYVTLCAGDMKDRYHVRALRIADGEAVWNYELDNSSPQKNSVMVSRAAPTPVVDARGLIAFFEGGNVVALDHEGKERWKRDLVEDFGDVEARHGLAASLEQDESSVYVWVERSENPYVLALSKESGETLWRADGVGGTSWASPRLVPVADGAHLVLSGSGRIVGLDPATGARLWELEDVANNTSSTPVPLGDDRFLIGASEGRGEQPSAAKKSNGVVRIAAAEDGTWTADFVWRARRAMSSFGSPVASGGNAYFVNRSGVVFCVDLETGEPHYSERSAESIWATPIAIGDRVYLFGKEGTTTVLRSGDAFEVLAENPLWVEDEPEPAPEGEEEGESRSRFGGPVLYAGAVAGDRLVLRRGDSVYCVTGK